MSLPGSTRQSICFEKALAKKMDARVKPGHDECFWSPGSKHNSAISPRDPREVCQKRLAF
jgi:hypothetical protein